MIRRVLFFERTTKNKVLFKERDEGSGLESAYLGKELVDSLGNPRILIVYLERGDE